jgi:hypothetical protein
VGSASVRRRSLYSAKCLEEEFCELRLARVLGSALPASNAQATARITHLGDTPGSRLLLTVVAMMVVMMAMSVTPAFAKPQQYVCSTPLISLSIITKNAGEANQLEKHGYVSVPWP